jgi:hypothetical protein
MRKSMVLAVFLVLVPGVAAPAWAQQDGEGGEASEAFVVPSGRADVPEGRRSATWWCSTARRPWMAPWTGP